MEGELTVVLRKMLMNGVNFHVNFDAGFFVNYKSDEEECLECCGFSHNQKYPGKISFFSTL